MKIGILTFHDGINHGAYLQCYSLMRVLSSEGHDVEIINYKNFKHWFTEYRVFLLRKNPLLAIRNYSKIRKFHKAHEKFNLSAITFSHSKVSKSHYDAVIVGSDIVWNYENPLFGFDKLYFGHGLNADKLISYAASFGAVTKESLPPSDVTTGLKKFDSISVRDNNSRDLVKTYIDRDAEVVLDPTFLSNFSGEEVLPEENNFILVYAFMMPEKIKEQVKEFARKNNKRIIAVAYPQSWCDKNLGTVDPFEWLGYFKKADYVLTSTFHGTLFSLKYQKQFCTIGNIAINNKAIHILNKVGLIEYLIQKDETVEQILSSQINYDDVNTKLQPEIDRSMSFLLGALKSD
ncbi:polysaccharide pyruvyl transferase family protein [Bacteroidota bacterium]